MPKKQPDPQAAAKRDLRHTLRRRLEQLTPAARSAASAALCARLANDPRVAGAGTLAAYMALASEPDLSAFIRERLTRGRTILLPRIVGPARDGIMQMHVVSDWDKDIGLGAHGIREPLQHCPVHAGPVDVALIPGLAFDRDCNRMGKGAGHYDRFLAGQPVRLAIGIGFLCQRTDSLPVEPHDRRMDDVFLA